MPQNVRFFLVSAAVGKCENSSENFEQIELSSVKQLGKKIPRAMAVLMTYHKLVERDAKHVDIQWKGEAIIELNDRVGKLKFYSSQPLQSFCWCSPLSARSACHCVFRRSFSRSTIDACFTQK